MRYRILFICTVLFFSIGNTQENDKQFAFRSLTVEEGLSQNSVVHIMQDSIGYMWFATQDGLNKYDGNTFTTYNKQFEDVTRPTYSKLGKVFTDRESRIWIVSNSRRLEQLNKEIDSFETVAFKPSVSTVFQDNEKHLYLGTYSQGLYKIDAKTKDTLQVLKAKDTLKTVYDFLETKDELLVATSSGVLSLRDESYSEVLIETTKEVHVSSIAQSQDKSIWIGSFGEGLFYKPLGQSSFKRFNEFNNSFLPESLNIQDILIDKQDRIWIATYGDGVYLMDFEHETIRHFMANKDDPFALHYNDVLCIYEDYTGTIWFGTDGSGLSYYDEHLVKFNVLTSKQVSDDVNVDVVRSIAVDNDDTIWLGTSGKGLTMANHKLKLFKTYTTDTSNLLSDRIMSLLFVDNELWIGHQGHGLQIRNELGEFKSFSELDNQTIWKIYKDLNNEVWLCTRDIGLIKLDKTDGVIENYDTENSMLTSNNIRTVEADSKNNLWIGTENSGLFVMNLQTKKIEKIEEIPYKIKSLHSSDNELWIGTNGDGIVNFDIENKTVKIYKTDYGIANNVIYAILPDNKGNLWLSSNKGITRFNPEHDKKQRAENFTKINGLQAFEFNTGAYFKHNNGQLYFGGIEGVNWFDGGKITYNQAKPRTIITKFEVFGKEKKITQNATFSHNENTMTFTFAAMHFSEPKKNYYRYQLVNNDPDWTVPEYNNIAHYTNLPPNEYTFKVMSSNYEGVWNKEPTLFSFTISKPWYATNISYSIYGLLLILSIYAIYRYFKFRWQIKTQLQLEHAETERLKKLDEFKTKLYTNISHEIRTPLTLISGPIDNQLSKEKLDESDKKELHMVKQNANRLLKLVNQMLDLSLIDSGQLNLKVSEGNLTILIKQIVAAFQYKASENQIKIESEIDQLEKVWFDADVIEKVTSNLLSNAIKYAPINSVISFHANRIEDTVVIAITNVNKSIGKKNLGTLFQRFYQDNESSEGIGVGLALVKDLVTVSHGTILANSIDPNKIQFTVTLPIDKEAFSDEEIVANKSDAVEVVSEVKEAVTSEDQLVLLIVEDDHDIRNFIKSIFENSYKIVEAENGKVGLEMSLEHIPDVIISDIMMPYLDGIELCNALKEHKVTSHIPIVLLTAKVGEENEIKGLRTGADAYVTKPFNTDKLKLQVDKLIQLRKQLQEHYSETFQFNTKTFKVNSTEHQFFTLLKEVLEKHLSSPEFNAEKLSKEMLISRMQLHRKLKALTNLTTSEFLRLERLKMSLPLLKNSDATIAEIAYQVGFNTPSYYIKSFKEVYKCTPNDYISKS